MRISFTGYIIFYHDQDNVNGTYAAWLGNIIGLNGISVLQGSATMYRTAKKVPTLIRVSDKTHISYQIKPTET